MSGLAAALALAVALVITQSDSRAPQPSGPGRGTAPAPVPLVLQNYSPITAERLKNPPDGDWLMIRRTYDGWGTAR